MATAQSYSDTYSATYHRKARKKLAAEGLCVWGCGRKQALKPGGGFKTLCRTCLTNFNERRAKARTAGKKGKKR